MLQVSALTELDAVNNIISTIGEAPINSLDNLYDVDAVNAYRILQDVSRSEQARGWSFNILDTYTLNRDMNTNKIPWSTNYLYLKGSNGEKLVRQGNFVKDLTKDTVIFDKDVECTAILYLPFESLPEQMRSYIISKAAHVFQSRYFGDDILLRVTEAMVVEAWQHLQEYEIDNNDYNLLDHTHVQELLSR